MLRDENPPLPAATLPLRWRCSCVGRWPAASCSAQDESENNATSSTTYDSTGKVTAISAPLTITVDSRRGPFTYQIDPDVHVFKADNKPGRIGDVHVGQRVTVYYFKRLGQETVARVVILKPENAAK